MGILTRDIRLFLAFRQGKVWIITTVLLKNCVAQLHLTEGLNGSIC